jgi:AraC family transcriptional regulator
MSLPINPPGTQLGGMNAVLAGVGARYHVPDFEGCLSIKTVLSGRAVWQAGGRTFPMVEDQYLVLNDRRRYSITIDSIDRVRTFCLFFERGFVEDVFRATVTDSATLLDTPQPTAPLGFFERLEMGSDRVAEGIGRLRAAIDSGLSREGWEEHFRSIAEALVWQHQNAAQAVARVPAMRAATRQEVYRRLLRGRDFLLSHLDGPAQLKQTAAAACLSPYHFHRAFTQVFGETPHACLARYRLDRAARLLRRGENSVTEVCLDTGFESVASFSTLFRKRFGLPPGQFRKIR